MKKEHLPVMPRYHTIQNENYYRYVPRQSVFFLVFAAGHQPAAGHILEQFEIFRSMVQWFNGSMVPWFNGSMVPWSSVTAALRSQRFA